MTSQQVWPAFWTLGSGKTWPQGGEIDIIESINLLPNNQIALHTTPGCSQSQNLGQTGQTTEGDCSTPQGCVVRETKANSYESGFAQAGGGVWATQIDASGIFIWFWSVCRIYLLLSFPLLIFWKRDLMSRRILKRLIMLHILIRCRGGYLLLHIQLMVATSRNISPLKTSYYLPRCVEIGNKIRSSTSSKI